MDDNTRRRLELMLQYDGNQSLEYLARAICTVQSQFNAAGRLNSGAYAQALIDQMGAAIQGYAQSSRSEVLKFSTSPEGFAIWKSYVNAFRDKAYKDWEKLVVSPHLVSEANAHTMRQVAAQTIRKWSDQILQYIKIVEFDFAILQPSVKPGIDTDGWPILDHPAMTTKSKGGRPPIKSHDAVAKLVTAELLQLPDFDFSRLVGESVKEMMSEAYVERGETPFVDIKTARKLLKEARRLRGR